MGLFTKQESENSKLHFILKLAFERIKNDMHNIFQWVDYFHKKHQEHDDKIARLEHSIAYMPNSREEIKKVIDYHYPYEQIMQKIDQINNRIDTLETKKAEKRPALQERLVRKIQKNSKDYIKSVILATIKKYARITGPQLKEIVVEEQGLCSKSSFYRLLGEIEVEHEISSFLDGKGKTYFLKAQIRK